MALAARSPPVVFLAATVLAPVFFAGTACSAGAALLAVVSPVVSAALFVTTAFSAVLFLTAAFFAGAFFTAVFFAGAVSAAAFFAGVFLAAAFFAGVFFATFFAVAASASPDGTVFFAAVFFATMAAAPSHFVILLANRAGTINRLRARGNGARRRIRPGLPPRQTGLIGCAQPMAR